MDLSNVYALFFLSLLILSFMIQLILDFISYQHRKKNISYIPAELAGAIEPDHLLKINRYCNEKLVISIIDTILNKAVLIAILFLSVIPRFYTLLGSISNNIYLIGLLFFSAYFIIRLLYNIPFELYYNFVLEKKYQFNQMCLKLWLQDLVKKTIMGLIISAVLLTALLFFLYTFKNWRWLLIWFFLISFTLLMQVIYPTLIAPLFNRFKPIENAALVEKINSLLLKTNLKSDGVYEMDASRRSNHSNAYFTGLGRAKRIVLFDTLLQQLHENEIVAVLAHEIGHFKKKHITRRLLLSSLITLGSLWIAHFFIDFLPLYQAFNMNQSEPFIGLIFLSIFFSPISFLVTPFFNYLSRRNEYEADQYAVKMSGQSQALRSALIKLNIDNLSDLYPADIYEWFYYSHPQLIKRINRLQTTV